MNLYLGCIQLLFYYPVSSFLLYIYLVVPVPKINAISINSIYSRFISKLMIDREKNF